MDYHNPIDLEGLPSDAFDSEDLDLDDQMQAGSDRYSSWPAESSPGPAEAHEDEGVEEYSDPEIDDAYGHQEGEEIYEDEEEDEDEDEDEDQEVDDEHSEHEAEDEDEDAFEYVLDDDEEEEAVVFAGQGEGGWIPEADLEEEMSDHQPSPAPHGFADFLADYRAHRNEEEEDDDDALFVDQGDFLPPLEDLLSSVRRNHERALDLVSELHSEVRNLGRGSVGPSRENHRQNHRHHPYGMAQNFGRERARMGDYRNNGRVRDELVEVEMQPPRTGMRRNRPSPRAEPEVIDLTEEPDSPEMPRAIVPPRARAPNAPQAQVPGRNPRRHMSLNQRTPSLSRSDGSLLGNQTNVIDLTLDDSPAPPPLPQPLPRRNNPDNSPHHRHNRHHHRRRPSARIQPIDVENHGGFGSAFAGLFRSRLGLIQRLGFGRAHDVEVQFIGGHGLNMDNPLAGNIPNLDYRVNGNNAAAGQPKPDHVPPPPAREGFTRDTGNADDVVICPSCSQELKYDPDGATDDAMSPRPAKKPRTRKDQAEHYFWALKDCGHVSFAGILSLHRLHFC
jgi:hypothetical protein